MLSNKLEDLLIAAKSSWSRDKVDDKVKKETQEATLSHLK